MVHKRYVWKNGKKHGPYYYESYREDGQVKKRYIGAPEEDKKKADLTLILLGVVVLLGLVFTFGEGFTGSVILGFGDEVSQGIELTIKEGELLPADTLLRVEQEGAVNEYLLSDVVSLNSGSGDFYAEGVDFSGSGDGLGFVGTKETFPEVSFKILVVRGELDDDSSDVVSEEESTSSGSSDSSEEESSEEETDSSEDTDTSEETEVVVEEESEESSEEAVEETEESSEAEVEESVESEEAEGEETEESVEEESSEEETEETETERGDSGEEVDTSGGSLITGNLILEGAIAQTLDESDEIISASTKGDEPYTLELGDEDKVSLISGSVEVDGESLDDSEISLSVEGDVLTVETSYSTEEEGFGEDYVGDSKKLVIDLESLGYESVEGLKATLNGGGVEILSVESGDSETTQEVEEETEETNVTVSANVSLIKDIGMVRITKGSSAELDLSQHFSGALSYEFNVTNVSGEFNENVLTLTPDAEFKGARQATVVAKAGETSVESNQFNILVSSGNLNIKTGRGEVRLGEKVKWQKNVTIDVSENVSVQLPKSAEKIVVQKVEGEQKIEEEVVVNKLDESGDVIETEVVGTEGVITGFLPYSGLFSITGRVIDGSSEVLESPDQEESVEVIIEVEEEDLADETDGLEEFIVEYETEAPQAVEQTTGETEGVVKVVEISAPDELEYTDVFSFTEIPEVLEVGREDEVQIRWVEGGQVVPADVYDLNGNGLLDYIEWITPHLSNQTFEIIYVSDALHLDSNRSVIDNVYVQVSELDGINYTIPSGDYLRITFETNLTNGKDITIYASGTGADVKVYEKDGLTEVGSFSNITNFDKKQIILSGLSEGGQDTFDLLSVNGDVSYDFLIDPTVSSCGTISAAGIHTLSQDISSANDCITIASSEVVLEGAGFTIIYGSGGTGKGVIVNPGLTNVTIKDLEINKSGTIGSDNYGIHYLSQTGYGRIVNNTINTNGGNKNWGIHLYNTSNLQVWNNTVSTNGLGESSHGIYLNGSDSSGSMGSNNTIRSNIIYANGSQSNMGIYVEDYTQNNTISYNNITTSSSNGTGANDGIRIRSFSRNQSVIGNNITILDGHGIDLSIINYSLFEENRIQIDSPYNQSSKGINLGGASHNLILNNFMNSTSDGTFGVVNIGNGGIHNLFENNSLYHNAPGEPTIYISSNSHSNNFTKNNITTIGIGSPAFYFDAVSGKYPNDTRLEDNNIFSSDLNEDLFFADENIGGLTLVDQYIGNYTFNETELVVEDLSYGKIFFLQGVNGTGSNFSNSVQITNNSAYINSDTDAGLNVSANITLYNIGNRGFSNPVVLRDSVTCDTTTNPACYNFTALTEDTIVFNVSSWSNHTIGNGGGGSISACQNITSPGVYTAAGDLDNVKDCIIISSSDVHFDGAGRTITYGNNGVAIKGINNVTNVSIYNVNIDENYNLGSNNHGIFFESGSGLVEIINNTINTSGAGGNHGIYIMGSNDSGKFIENNTIYTSSSTVGGNIGIYLEAMSNSVIRNNFVHTDDSASSSGGNHGIYVIQWPNNTIITDNTVFTDGNRFGNDGIGVFAGSHVNITNNTVNPHDGATNTGNTGIYATGQSTSGGVPLSNNLNLSNNNIYFNQITGVSLLQGISISSISGAFVSNNYINTTDNSIVNGVKGIAIATFSNGTVESNFINITPDVTGGASKSTNGLFIQEKTYGSVFENNSINLLGAGVQNVLTVQSPSSYNNFTGNTLNLFSSAPTIPSSSILFEQDSTDAAWDINNTIFENNTLVTAESTPWEILIQSSIEYVKFINMVHGRVSIENHSLISFENSSHGSIDYYYGDGVSPGSNDLDGDITFADNLAGFNVITDTNYNQPANITLYNVGDRGFDGISILRNNTAICGSTTSPSCSNFTALDADTVVFNVSGWSNYSVGNDPSGPLVTINLPESGGTYYLDDLPLNFNVSLDQNGSVMYSLDGGVNNVTMPWSGNQVSLIGDLFNVTNDSIAEGNYTFSVYANDTAGNNNYTESVDFTFFESAVPPLVTINFPANTTYTNDDLPFNFNISLNENVSAIYSLEDWATGTNVTMPWSGNQVSLIGDLFNVTNDSIAEGGYTFRVYANDSSGNVNLTESVQFTYLDLDNALTTCQDITSAGVYTVIQDLPVLTRTTCLNITTSDVIVDGQGNSFNTGTYSVFIVPGVSNITVKNADADVVWMASNDTIISNLTMSGADIYNAVYSKGSYVSLDSLNITSSGGGAFSMTPIVWVPAGQKSFGVNITDVNISVENAIQFQFAMESPIEYGGSQGIIANNTVKYHPAGVGPGHIFTGMKFIGTSDQNVTGNLIQGNHVDISAINCGRGIALEDYVSGNHFDNNIVDLVITSPGANPAGCTDSPKDYGIGFNGTMSTYNNFTNIRINSTLASEIAFANTASGSSHNYFENITVLDTNKTDYNEIDANSAADYISVISSYIELYDFDYAGKISLGDTEFGKLDFVFENVSANSGSNLSDVVRFKNVTLLAKPADYSAFRVRANGTFYGVGNRFYEEPIIALTYGFTGQRVECEKFYSPFCYNFTALTEDTVLFNMSALLGNNFNYTIMDKTYERNVSFDSGWNYFGLNLDKNLSGDKNVSLETGWNLVGYSAENNVLHSGLKFTTDTDAGVGAAWGDSADEGDTQFYLSYYDNDDSTNSRRYKYAGLADETNLAEGKAYWVYANESGNFTASSSDGSNKSKTIAWGDLILNDGSENKNLISALAAGWIGLPGDGINNIIKKWNKETQSYEDVASSEALGTWEGYVVRSNKDNLTLVVES